MLWLALHFPLLPLEVPLRGHAWRDSNEPWAINEGRTVFAVSTQAQALGVRPGMALSAAWALAPQLRVQPRSETEEKAALEGIAGWLCRFTPCVSLEPPAGALAEVSGSLRLFGGLQSLVARMQMGLEELGFTASFAAAPTVRGAWWLACGGHSVMLEHRSGLERALRLLPVAKLGIGTRTLESLCSLGVVTVDDLIALPRAGAGRRFERALLDELDRALGTVPEPRSFFVPPARFSEKLELPAEVSHAEGVLFAARRLLLQLEGVLAARQQAVRGFTLILMHRDACPSAVEVELGSAGREAERFILLLRERLGRFALIEPVEAIRVKTGDFVPLQGYTPGLFGDKRSEAEGWTRVIERLQARLGGDAVFRLGLQAEHRPEWAWRALQQDEQRAPPTQAAGERPSWLIEPPRRLNETGDIPEHGGALELLAGPERIESGWWDEGEVRRDYFIARTPNSALLWIFREAGGSWYLHGIFA